MAFLSDILQPENRKVHSESIWSIPRIWPDSVVFIIGGGPSLLKQDLSLIHNQRVIGVNQAYKLGPWVDVCFYGDKEWYEQNIPEICNYGGLIVTCSRITEKELDRPFIKFLRRGRQSGLEMKRKTHVAWNSNSGAAAIGLAYWLGASTVVLLGFDMQQSEKGQPTHWHNDYPHQIDKRGNYSDPYPKFRKHWPNIKADADKLGLRIINATVGGSLEEFERMPLEQVCKELCQ